VGNVSVETVAVGSEYAGKFETGAAAPVVPHLRFIDGMRGLAALYVVLHHSAQFAFPTGSSSKALFFFRWGRAAVTVFIAISGYCLALPVVRSHLTLKGGAWHFFKKRARRILTPYYVALAMGIAFCVFFLTPAGIRLRYIANPLIAKAIITHLLLVQNWSTEVAYMFNGPLWSVATEVQIYLFFPLIVLVWRRFGTIWMLAGTFVVSHLALFLSGHRGSANYLFIFALGAWAAERSECKLDKRDLLVMKSAFWVSAIAFLVFPNVKEVYSDLIVGVGVSCLMVLCARTTFWPRSVLSFRPFAWLGGFSYSIYLVHNVIQQVYFDTPIRITSIRTGVPLFLLLCFGLTPIVLGLSYVFHLAIERPFMTVHKVRGKAKPLEAAKAVRVSAPSS
jgi:peptidoglycan/LPS O-acetylase OafA/YrhL